MILYQTPFSFKFSLSKRFYYGYDWFCHPLVWFFANGESTNIGMNGCGGKSVTIESRFIQSYYCSSNRLKVAEKY